MFFSDIYIYNFLFSAESQNTKATALKKNIPIF